MEREGRETKGERDRGMGRGGGRENEREGIEREAGERGKERDPTNCRSSYSANYMRKNKEIGYHNACYSTITLKQLIKKKNI